MNEPVLLRHQIVRDADAAAQRCVAHGVNQPNPHVIGTDAYAVWKAAYERHLLLHSAPQGVEVEGGA